MKKNLSFLAILSFIFSFAKAQNVTITPNGIAPISSTTSYSIGQSYGGGVVFYVYDNGQHGLIAAPSNIVVPPTNDSAPYIRWSITPSFPTSTANYTPTYAKADGFGAGAINTMMISLTVPSQFDFAAKLCVQYSVTANGVKYGDWYLPSKHELHLMYLNRVIISNFGGYYWSSNEGDNGPNSVITSAWAEDGSTGQQFQLDKFNSALQVRAIRRF